MIQINLEKAKAIGHNLRRQQRADAFKPFDEIISKMLPEMSAEEAERQRQVIRQQYEIIQEKIDASETVEAIKSALTEATTTNPSAIG